LERTDPPYVSRIPPRIPQNFIQFIDKFTKEHPCFYLDELQAALKETVPEFQSTSISSICRILRKDCGLTRKILTRRAKEATPKVLQNFYDKLHSFYSYPDQVIFDETSKDARSALRKYAWSKRNTPAYVELTAGKSKRVSVLASFTAKGFMAWRAIEGTYDRQQFHDYFKEVVFPYINPFPLPRSIVILDNAKIHMYPEIEELVNHAVGILLYLPPYCPHLNPIELGFGQLKKWIQKHGNLAFRWNPQFILDMASFYSIYKWVL
jgi:hypothetical protein